jgi:hypothetical protein
MGGMGDEDDRLISRAMRGTRDTQLTCELRSCEIQEYQPGAHTCSVESRWHAQAPRGISHTGARHGRGGV